MFILARDLHALFPPLLRVYAQRVWLRPVLEEHGDRGPEMNDSSCCSCMRARRTSTLRACVRNVTLSQALLFCAGRTCEFSRGFVRAKGIQGDCLHLWGPVLRTCLALVSLTLCLLRGLRTSIVRRLFTYSFPAIQDHRIMGLHLASYLGPLHPRILPDH